MLIAKTLRIGERRRKSPPAIFGHEQIPLLVIASSLAAFAVSGGYTIAPREWFDPSCNIKGNISISSGERIYHVPGQENYDVTVIRADYGERWFCSEDNARSANWRKAGR
jgi:hypothetical protein